MEQTKRILSTVAGWPRSTMIQQSIKFTLQALEDAHDNELQVGNANNSLLLGIISSAPLTVEQAQMGKAG